jgi:nucleoside-diphosphate-sugar epimerase
LIKNENLLRKTNIEGTANIVNFVLPKGKKLCYISSTAALGDLASHETIITEEIEWNPENRTVIMRFLNMVPKSGEVSKKGVIIVNPGVVLDSKNREANF